MKKFSNEQELAYLALVNKVAKIDKDAALYMLTAMREIKFFYACGDIRSVVFWGSTVQGTDFWHNISKELENAE